MWLRTGETMPKRPLRRGYKVWNLREKKIELQTT